MLLASIFQGHRCFTNFQPFFQFYCFKSFLYFHNIFNDIDYDRIKYAQPSQRVPYSYGRTNCALSEGLYMCGDHVGTATLNG